MDARTSEKMSNLPQMVERLLDSAGALLLFLIVASAVGVNTVSIVTSGVVVLAITCLAWIRWGAITASVVSIAIVGVVVLVGVPAAAGILAVITYQALSLWYLDVLPVERLFSVPFECGDGSKRTLREQLRRLLEQA
jgi:hypothetical protein